MFSNQATQQQAAASASIGQQEAQNKMAERQQAASNQEMERRGAMEVQALKGCLLYTSDAADE